MRKKLLVGNWKMNKTIAETKAFAHASLDLLKKANAKHIDIGVTPPYLSLQTLITINPKLIVGAQNVHFKGNGAYTGEVSVPMLKEIGVMWSLVGHSERRTYYNETNESCNLKNIALLENGMTPLYCVGETLNEFEKGITKEVIKAQIDVGLLGIEDIKEVVIAYEPVWSIGTGKNASKEIAEDICGYIRTLLKEKYGEEAERVRILYGGSVKPDNIKAYMAMPNIDGALVGGASLTVESFSELINNI
ncbi:MAG: triose-phosphate isomerase [Bacilli bacterium]|nr:triose-phosphate isomerase [Bacilli bacterium]